MSLNHEFGTIDLILTSTAETRGVDAFALAVIKHERQLRKLFTYSVFQFPCFSRADEPQMRAALVNNRRVYGGGFILGLDELWPRPVSQVIGPRYDALMASLAGQVLAARNKIFHGQVTDMRLDRPALLSMVADIREWCTLLADGAQKEIGYDGFARDSYRKLDPTLHQRFKRQLASVPEYSLFLDQFVARP